MSYVRPSFFKDKLKTFLVQDLKASLPQKQRLFYDYSHSVFKGVAWPFLMPVAQTVKINDVYLGTDKVDHFFASGRRYLNAYRRALDDGKSPIEAEMRAVRYGISWAEETGVLGEWSAGSFSFADLESNFQGLELGRDFCEGENPIVKFDAKRGWIKQRPIHIEDYVSPLWDESFNNSVYIRSRWKKVKKNLKREICYEAQRPQIRALRKSYHKRLAAQPTPFHVEYTRGLILSHEIPDPQSQSLGAACGFDDAEMQGPNFWQVPKESKDDDVKSR